MRGNFSFMDYWTLRECAAKTGYSLRWLKALIADNKLPSVLVGNQRFVSRADMLAYKGATKSKGGRKQRVYRL